MNIEKEENRFNRVSVETLANVYYEGRAFSRTLWFEDGQQKILGILLPVDEKFSEYRFETDISSERVQITLGECEVKIEGEDDFKFYRAGQGFHVVKNSHYIIKNEGIVQYTCNFEG